MRNRTNNRQHVLDPMIRLLKQPTLPLSPGPPFADVSKETDKERITELIASSHGKFNRELCAITPHSRDFNPPVQHWSLASGQMVTEASLVSGAVLLSYNQFTKQLAKCLLRLPPEDLSGVVIPPYNQATNVHDDNRIQCGVENGLQSSVKKPPTHVHAATPKEFSQQIQWVWRKEGRRTETMPL
jgi:hypothetical protein